MIPCRQPDQLGRRPKTLREVMVFRRRVGGSAGMIVREDDSVRPTRSASGVGRSNCELVRMTARRGTRREERERSCHQPCAPARASARWAGGPCARAAGAGEGLGRQSSVGKDRVGQVVNGRWFEGLGGAWARAIGGGRESSPRWSRMRLGTFTPAMKARSVGRRRRGNAGRGPAAAARASRAWRGAPRA